MFGNFSQPHREQLPWAQYKPHGFYQRERTFRQQTRTMQSNDNFWCETCDRGFPTSDILEKHKQQHQKCNIDGCQFIAHPKVITKHIQMQHSTGLYKKIAKLNNPEEIQKWREERKKKYPTKMNVEKKVAEIKEKIERGEKIGLNGNQRKKQCTTGSHHKRNNAKKTHNKTLKHGKTYHGNDIFSSYSSKRTNIGDIPAKNCKNKKFRTSSSLKKNAAPIMEDKRVLKPFAGIQYMLLEEDNELQSLKSDLIDDDDEDIPIETSVTIANSLKPIETSVCGALSSLMCNYGSSDEEAQPEVNRNTVNIDLMTPLINLNNSPIKMCEKENKNNIIKNVNDIKDTDEDNAPEEMQIVKENTNKREMTNNESGPKAQIKRKREAVQQRKPVHLKPKIPSTLLRKLLLKEIQHERNVVLQCIRYVIRNNYFDK